MKIVIVLVSIGRRNQRVIMANKHLICVNTLRTWPLHASRESMCKPRRILPQIVVNKKNPLCPAGKREWRPRQEELSLNQMNKVTTFQTKWIKLHSRAIANWCPEVVRWKTGITYILSIIMRWEMTNIKGHSADSKNRRSSLKILSQLGTECCQSQAPGTPIKQKNKPTSNLQNA